MSDVVVEVIESKELNQGQVTALRNFIQALFGVNAGEVQGVSFVREEDPEGGAPKISVAARLHKVISSEQTLDLVEQGKLSRIVRRQR
jgi:hypothetical protein